MKSSVHFTQKELMQRWGVTLRTVQREIRRYLLTPADYIGIQPIFNENAVQEMERRRLAERAARGGFKMPGGKK